MVATSVPKLDRPLQTFFRFLLADGLYAIPGVGLVFFGSYFLTESFTLVIEDVEKVRHWIILIVLLTVAAAALYKYYRFRRDRVEHNDFSPVSLPSLMPPETLSKPQDVPLTTTSTEQRAG